MTEVNDSRLPARSARAEPGGEYLAFFDCFNRGLFFEAHEVLERVWLPERGRAKDRFYKGLIQVAGAFVHLRKNRAEPAGRLLLLARANLQPYRSRFEGLDVAGLLGEIEILLERLLSSSVDPAKIAAPRLQPSCREAP